jgi:gliding motility-associated-like protein
MKKNVLALVAFLLIYTTTKAQLDAQKATQEKTKTYMPGTVCKECNEALINSKNYTPPSVQNGNQSISVSYSITSCGLNYTTGSVVLEQRTANRSSFIAPVGRVQPAPITISGIPSRAVILKAFLYTALLSDNSTPITLNLTNPAGTSYSYSMAMVGQDISPCWSAANYQNTYTYRADVTSVATGNGAYSVSGLPVYPNSGDNDVEGATLIIIYTDPSSGYTGTMIIADGGQVNTGYVSTTGTITGFNINANSTYANSFMLISDLQEEANATLSINGSSGSIASVVQDWWNYAQITTSFTAGQNSCTYQVSDNGDCYFISAIGLYYQSNAPNNSSLPTSNLVQCNNFIADTLNAGSGFSTYQWSTGATTQTVVINSPGTYWVKTGNSYGCIVTDTIKASVINPVNAHVLRDTAVCSFNGSYTANATYNGAQGYKWYDGSTNPVKTFTASGTYSVNIYFAGGCVVTNTFNLIINTIPHVNLGNDTVICRTITQPIIYNAGASSGYTYHWSTGASTNTISVNSGGIYSVTVTSAAGCKASDSVKVSVIAANAYNVFDTSLCNINSFPVLLKAPPVPGNNNIYYWNNFPGGSTYSDYYAGPTTLNIYVNGGSCIITDIFNVVLDTVRPHIKDVAFCNSFTPYTVSAGNYAHYLWSTGATTSSIVISNPGTYWVKVISAGGCVEADTFTVSVINPANVHVLKDTVICSSYYYYNYYANAYVPGAQSYLWNTGYTSPIQYIYNSGSYWVDIYFAGGCVVRDSFKVVFNQSPSVYLGNDQVICGPLSSPIILGGYYYPSYQWSTGATTPSISVTTSGIYWETVTAANGCKATDSVNIQIYPYGNTYHDTNIVICSATNAFPVILHSSVPNTYYNYYYWSNGNYGSTAYIYSSGTYYVQVDINGNTNCIVTDTFHVSTGTIIKPVIPDIIQCNTTTPDVLDAGTGYTNYYWSTGQNTQSITVNTSGVYVVTVSNSQGCKTKDTINVAYNTSPVINILKDTSICNQSSVPIDASYPGAVSYLWSDGFTSPIHNISAGHYWVIYTMNTTCTANDSFNVTVKQVTYVDALPNIVTPNNDGKNDFIDFGVYQFSAMQLYIYDRWGTKIYESNNTGCVWSPTCDDGTYFYVLTYNADCDTGNEGKTLKGFFTVLR